MRGVADGADEADLSLQIIHAAAPNARRRVSNAAVDAFIAWSVPADDPALAAALERHIPLVTVGAARDVPNVPYVSADYRGGARLAAQHLLDHGFQRFAVVGSGLPGEQFTDRLAGWRSAIEAAGIDWSTVLHIHPSGNSRTTGSAAATAFLDIRDSSTRWGILAMTDVLALGALNGLHRAGVDVPNDVAVVGFDDIEEASMSNPGLTTVHQDLMALGKECALRAAGRVHGPTRPHSTALIVRGSTDPTAEPPTTKAPA
jgi:DNA-binding LacI/PurR family transcriptional regulator